MALPNYVKFQRGSLAAYNNLVTKDENTLYFIYDANDSSKGSLYLGDRLISSNVGGASITSLSELADVITSEAQTGDFLVLNSEGKWAAVGATAVAATIVEAGGLSAEIKIDNAEFKFNAVNSNLELNGYAEASVGMIPIKSSTGIAWQNAPIDLSSRVGTLETNVSSIQDKLVGIDGTISQAINSAIANSNHLTYTVVESLDAATAINTIYLHTNNSSSDNNNLFDEFMIVNGQLEKIGSFTSDLSGYATTTALSALDSRVQTLETLSANFVSVTAVSALEERINSNTTAIAAIDVSSYVKTTTFNAVVGNIEQLNNYTTTANSNVVESIIDIYQRITWQDIS